MSHTDEQRVLSPFEKVMHKCFDVIDVVLYMITRICLIERKGH
jgi:hypothetical protein